MFFTQKVMELVKMFAVRKPIMLSEQNVCCETDLLGHEVLV